MDRNNKIIKNDKRSKVVYNISSQEYKKNFYPKWSKRLKCFFKMGKYPGYNFNYISKVLNSVGIKTVEVINFNKYEVITKELQGTTLEIALKNSSVEKTKMYIEKYIELIKKLINNKIYFADYTCNNFFIFNDEIYALDLEDYRKDYLFIFRKKNMLDKMESKIKTIPEECLEKLNINYNDILESMFEDKSRIKK